MSQTFLQLDAALQPPAAAPAQAPGAAITPDEVAAELTAELGWRERVHTKLVAERRMTMATMKRRRALIEKAIAMAEWFGRHGEFARRCLRFRKEIEECLVVLEGGDRQSAIGNEREGLRQSGELP